MLQQPVEVRPQGSLKGSGIQRPMASRTRIAILVLLFLFGVALRVYKFPSVPVGLHQDEMSEEYESYSLLHTGKDRWGYPWPAYFLSWGSGQNVMQSYLTIPVVAITGLTRSSTRIIPLVFGLLSLPLLFLTVEMWEGEVAALGALLFLACSPWAVMISRMGIENVELPCFLLLGVYSFSIALRTTSLLLISISLLPFAGALYCYGTVVVVLPTMLLLLAAVNWRSIRVRPGPWGAAAGSFVVCSTPIALFVTKNYIFKRDFGFERWLPISIPLLPIARLDQAKAELAGDTALHHNLVFLRHGLSDNIAWFQVIQVHPLPKIVFGLAVLGIARECWRIAHRQYRTSPFLLWLIACAPLFVLFPLNISRAIAVYMPLIALAGSGFSVLYTAVRSRTYQIAVLGVLGLVLAFPTVRFVHDYFGSVYRNEISPTFYPELPEALQRAEAMDIPGGPIYVSDTILLNYVDVLFYLKVDPATFQRSGATWNRPDFDGFRFSRSSALQSGKPLVFILAHNEPPLCADATDTQQVGALKLGVCR